MFPTFQKVGKSSICMISRASWNVKDLLKPLWLALEPPFNYPNKSRIRDFGKVRNFHIGTCEKARAGKPPRLVLSILGNLANGMNILEMRDAILVSFNPTKEIQSSSLKHETDILVFWIRVSKSNSTTRGVWWGFKVDEGGKGKLEAMRERTEIRCGVGRRAVKGTGVPEVPNPKNLTTTTSLVCLITCNHDAGVQTNAKNV